MSKITVTTIAGQTSGGDANKVIIESGDTLQVDSNATVGGDLTVDTSTLKVDASNNRVGMGVASPSRQVEISRSIADGSGELGIVSSDSSTSGALGNIHFGNSTDSSLASIRATADGATDAGKLEFNTEKTGAAIETALEIDSNGRVTKPLQPAFHAYRNGGNYTKSSAGYHKVLADATRYNIGSHYDTSNNRFTAPVAGRYLFTIAINTYTNGADNQYGSFLYLNGSNYIALARHYARGDGDMVASGSAILQLAANDYVEMWSYNNDTSFGYSSGTLWQGFTGCLLT